MTSTGQLCSSNETTRINTVLLVQRLALQCSDTGSCVDMLNQLLTIPKGWLCVSVRVCTADIHLYLQAVGNCRHMNIVYLF